MAFVEGGEPKIIENTEGVRTTPSIVALSKAGERLRVSWPSVRQSLIRKYNLWREADDGAQIFRPDVKRDRELSSFKIEEAEAGGIKINWAKNFIDRRKFRPWFYKN